MAQGRGSAITATTVALALLSLLATAEVAMATVYNVGDFGGWTFNVDGWAHGKHFRAGDVLVFKYPPGQHNVVPVNKLGYDACIASMFGSSYNSGMDRITLRRGANYFICGFPGHCIMGMKVAIHAM